MGTPVRCQRRPANVRLYPRSSGSRTGTMVVVLIKNRPLALKAHLVSRGMTMSDFARRLGLSRQHVTEVLNRTHPLTRDFALAAARELNLSLDEAALLLGPPASWTQGRWPPPQP